MSLRVIAIDWSGAKKGAHHKIWLAEVVDGELVRLEKGRDRPKIAEHLISEAQHSPQMIVGLDFAFSLPAWFLEDRRLSSAQEFWALADEKADEWLAACQPPFWGKAGHPFPDIPGRFRLTEKSAPVTAGISPKSVFQIGGAGAVGTGSLRGMGVLHRLHQARFSIWPFDPPGWPQVVEIYPRLLTKAVKKSHSGRRADYLAAHYPQLTAELRERAASGEDAFDAAVSALVMAEHIEDLKDLPTVTDRQLVLEGLIWHPGWRSDASRVPLPVQDSG
jgi:hypothetical protein